MTCLSGDGINVWKAKKNDGKEEFAVKQMENEDLSLEETVCVQFKAENTNNERTRPLIQYFSPDTFSGKTRPRSKEALSRTTASFDLKPPLRRWERGYLL